MPTWNYAAVHAYGRPVLLEEPAPLTARSRARRDSSRTPEPWRLAEQAAEFVAGMLRGIVAFEMPIERLEGRLSSARTARAEDRTGAIKGLEATGDPLAVATAALMAERARAQT